MPTSHATSFRRSVDALGSDANHPFRHNGDDLASQREVNSASIAASPAARNAHAPREPTEAVDEEDPTLFEMLPPASVPAALPSDQHMAVADLLERVASMPAHSRAKVHRDSEQSPPTALPRASPRLSSHHTPSGFSAAFATPHLGTPSRSTSRAGVSMVAGGTPHAPGASFSFHGLPSPNPHHSPHHHHHHHHHHNHRPGASAASRSLAGVTDSIAQWLHNVAPSNREALALDDVAVSANADRES